MGGASRKNFDMFRKLCGDNTLKNVVITTTMWAQVDPATGDMRERRLQTEDKFFKPAIDGGAKMVRHDNTPESARKIVWDIVQRNSPEVLCIQKELVDEHLNITATSVVRELDRNLADLRERHDREIQELTRRLEAALEGDARGRGEVEEKRRNAEIAHRRMEANREHLAQRYAEEKAAMRRMIDELQIENEKLRNPRVSPEERRQSSRRIDQNPLGYMSRFVKAVKRFIGR